MKPIHKTLICWIFAGGLVLLAEIGTRYALKRDLLQDHSLVGTVETHLQQLRRRTPTLWLLGNSTLYYGVDEGALSERAGVETIRLAHGSATLSGSVDMASYYLHETSTLKDSKPVLVFCVTPDDLNCNGFRARVSKAYRGGIHPVQTFLRVLRLARCRRSIIEWIHHMYVKVRGTKRNVRAGQGTTVLRLNTDWLRELSENYELDMAGLDSMAALRDAGYPVVLVNMPVTAMYCNFFDSQSYGITVREIRARLQVFCVENDIEWIDLGEAISDESLFRDPYHVSELRGRGVLTGLMGDALFDVGRGK